MTLFYHHEACERHDTGAGHPESAGRLKAVRDAVLTASPKLVQATPEPVALETLIAAHSERHVERLFACSPAEGRVAIDGDTTMMAHSLDAAMLAAGALAGSVDQVATGQHDKAFCCVRPPGHHAEREQSMGFCLFNNIAVAAYRALNEHGMKRVAILDFDVHHGNGTEDIFRDDPRVLLCSSFQHPFYPNTNSPNVEGELVNVPLPAGTGSDAFRKAIVATWRPALAEFQPELILVSAGFDAHVDDPLAGLNLRDDDYAWLGMHIGEWAADLCDGRVIAGLEGGYNLAALGRSAAMFTHALGR
ncbi:MAG: histone deacetylase family protein [Gammaproteobacteria bacterium]